MLVFLIVCAALALLLASPITLRFRYEDFPRLRVWFLCFFYTIPLDKKQKAKKQSKESPKKRRKKKAAKQEKKTDPFRALVEKKGLAAAIGDLCGALRLIFERAARLCSHVRIPRLRLSITVGGTDAAQTAILCGGVCAAVYPLLGFTSALMQMHSPHIEIQPDYTCGDWSAHCDVKARVALWWLLVAGVSALVALIGSKIQPSNVHQTRATPPRDRKKQSKKGGVSK